METTFSFVVSVSAPEMTEEREREFVARLKLLFLSLLMPSSYLGGVGCDFHVCLWGVAPRVALPGRRLQRALRGAHTAWWVFLFFFVAIMVALLGHPFRYHERAMNGDAATYLRYLVKCFTFSRLVCSTPLARCLSVQWHCFSWVAALQGSSTCPTQSRSRSRTYPSTVRCW